MISDEMDGVSKKAIESNRIESDTVSIPVAAQHSKSHKGTREQSETTAEPKDAFTSLLELVAYLLL